MVFYTLAKEKLISINELYRACRKVFYNAKTSF